MITIITHFFLFLIVSYYNGKLFSNIAGYNKFRLNFFETSIFGLITTSFLAQIINFFFPLNDYIIIFNLFLIFIYIFFNKKNFFSNKVIKPSNIALFFFVILQIYGSGFSDDLNHYHYSYIKNTDNTNYILGLGHLHHAFALSSIWLVAHSYFNFDYSSLQDIHVLNALILFLFISIFLKEIEISFSTRKYNYIPFVLFILLFVLLKYTRLKEFGIDRPAFLIMFFLIFFYFKNFDHIKLENYLNKKITFLTYLSLFIFFIKISYFFIGLIPIYLIIKYRNYKILRRIEFIPIYIIILTYLIKNILISGCLFYPIPLSCVEWISWNTKENAEKWYILGEILNKAWWKYEGNLNDISYIENFNWVNTWYQSTKIELLEFSITSIIALFLTILVFKKKAVALTKSEITYLTNSFNLIMVIFLISISLFFFKLPVIRMAHYIFVFISILFLIKFYSKFNIDINKFALVGILSFCLIFNASKNLLRINSINFENNPLKMIEPIKSKQLKKKLNDFSYFLGWYGNYPAGNTILDDKVFSYKRVFIFDIIYKTN